jgi:hypothetical protein
MPDMTSTPMMPLTRSAPFTHYNPTTNIMAEQQAKGDLAGFATAQGNQAFKELAPEQQKPFMPQWRPGQAPGTEGMGHIKISSDKGGTQEEYPDNTAGITKANFMGDYRQRLAAGAGNMPLPGRPLTGLESQNPTGPQSEYEQLRQKVNQATFNRIHMIPQTGPQQVPQTSQDPYQVRVAQIRAQQGASHDAATEDIATGKNDTTTTVAAGKNTTAQTIATGKNDTTTTVAAGKNATATGIAEGRYRTEKEIASMNDDEKKSELQKLDEYRGRFLGIQQQNADTNAEKAGKATTSKQDPNDPEYKAWMMQQNINANEAMTKGKPYTIQPFKPTGTQPAPQTQPATAPAAPASQPATTPATATAAPQAQPTTAPAATAPAGKLSPEVRAVYQRNASDKDIEILTAHLMRATGLKQDDPKLHQMVVDAIPEWMMAHEPNPNTKSVINRPAQANRMF